MNKKHITTLEELKIKKAPEEQSIEAANHTYTKKQLAYFIERHDLDIAKSWKKAEIVDALTKWMEAAQKELLETESDLHSFYSSDVVNNEAALNLYDDALSDDKLENILKLVEHGLAYNVDGQLWVPSNEVIETTPAEVSAKQADEPKQDTQKETAAPSSQSKPVSYSSPSAFQEDDIEKKKEARLKYLKKQAKRKKKGKKRK